MTTAADSLQLQAKAMILQETRFIEEVPEDALVASGWNLIDNGTCTETEWREAVDEAINELLDEGVVRSTLIYSATPVKSLYNGMVQFVPAIARVEAPAKVSQTNSPSPAKQIPSLSKERIEELLALTLDDETDSPLEKILQSKYGEFSTRHGAYEIILMYSKKLETISHWTKDTPSDLKKIYYQVLLCWKRQRKQLTVFLPTNSNAIAHLANDGQ